MRRDQTSPHRAQWLRFTDAYEWVAQDGVHLAAKRVDDPHDGLELRTAMPRVVRVAGTEIPPPVPAGVWVGQARRRRLRVEHHEVVGIRVLVQVGVVDEGELDRAGALQAAVQ